MREFLRKIESSCCSNPNRLVMLWLGVWWLLNLVQAACSELANDEAYYHMFAESLDWGYFDHPPITAWLVWLGEHLFDGELGVRFFFTLLQPLYLWMLWRLIRPADVSRNDASLFVTLSAAILVLQLYGFIAVPDGPLLFTATIFLLALKYFANNCSLAWLWLGVAMALMAYSKYHGALVVIFALVANPRLLLRPTLYLSGLVTLVLLIPHLLWQYNHDWASFVYHLSARNATFQLSYLTDYIVNMLVVFNPFFVPFYIKAWREVKPVSAVDRTLKFFPPAFIGFFLISSLRGYVQPQWTIVAAFGLLYLLFTYARRHSRTRRYLMRMGFVTIALVGFVRLIMIFNPIGIRFEVFDNSESYGRIATLADGRPVLFNGNYSHAAKYRFYTGGEAWCQPSITYRTHHWQFRDDDDRFAGREVLVQTWDRLATDTTLTIHVESLANGNTFAYMVDPDFRPVRKVLISCLNLPTEVHVGDELSLDLHVENPYSYPVEISADQQLVIVWKHGRFRTEEFVLPLTCILPAKGEITLHTTFSVPEKLSGEWFDVGFSLRRSGYAHWFNGTPQRVNVLAL